jgi:hypothetical protein
MIDRGKQTRDVTANARVLRVVDCRNYAMQTGNDQSFSTAAEKSYNRLPDLSTAKTELDHFKNEPLQE